MTGNKRNKRRPAVNVQQVDRLMQMLTTAATASKPQPPPNRRRKARRKRRPAAPEEGMITMRRHELVTTLTTGADGKLAGKVELKPTSFTFLKGIAPSFERSRWLKMHVYYKPAVAMTTGGLVALGMDWDGKTDITTREAVSAFTPSMHFPVWKDISTTPMVLPASKLQTRTWYIHASTSVYDACPGILRYVGEANVKDKTSIGELWIYYEIQMQGTNPG